eukprot:362949-Chlamydomonas_euryale.AAC.3
MVRGSRAQMLASGITPLGAATNGDSGDDIEIMDAFSKLVGGVDEVRRRGSTGWRRVQVNTDKDVDAVIKELQEDGGCCAAATLGVPDAQAAIPTLGTFA